MPLAGSDAGPSVSIVQEESRRGLNLVAFGRKIEGHVLLWGAFRERLTKEAHCWSELPELAWAEPLNLRNALLNRLKGGAGTSNARRVSIVLVRNEAGELLRSR